MARRCRLLVSLSVLLLSLCLGSASIAELEPAQAEISALTVSEYIGELDRLASATRQLALPEQVPKLSISIPPVWRIQTAQQTFEVSSEWLRHDLNDWQKKPSQEIRDSMVGGLLTLRSEAAAFEDSPVDISEKRVVLNRILAGREFQNVHRPTWLDRLKQRALELLLNLLGRVFQSSAIPTIRNLVVYGLMGLALAAMAYWMYRTIRNSAGPETILPHPLPVSSKGWKVWMTEARMAADGANWRNAIHLGYWCGISFLEAQGVWRPDTARTPREYLRLLPNSSEHRQTLGTLTRTFERVWYGADEADANAFNETLAQLERLGCQSN
jgi:hypothetical protein